MVHTYQQQQQSRPRLGGREVGFLAIKIGGTLGGQGMLGVNDK